MSDAVVRTPMAGWQSGYAAACKAVYAGSIPTPASTSRYLSGLYPNFWPPMLASYMRPPLVIVKVDMPL